MSIFSSPWLEKVVGEIRFRPTLEWYGSIPFVAKHFEKDFEDWNAVNPSSILLYTKSKKKALKLENNLFAYLTELNTEEESRSQLPKYLDRIAKHLSNDYAVKTAFRVGLRTTTVFPSNIKYVELADLLFSKFYGHNSDLKEISCDTVKDDVFILEAEKNGFFNRVQIGPVTKDEAVRIFQTTFSPAVDSIENCFLLVDIDIYTSEPSFFSDLPNTIEKAVQENFRIQKGYLSFLQS